MCFFKVTFDLIFPVKLPAMLVFVDARHPELVVSDVFRTSQLSHES